MSLSEDVSCETETVDVESESVDVETECVDVSLKVLISKLEKRLPILGAPESLGFRFSKFIL